MPLDKDMLVKAVHRIWDTSIVPTLSDFIKIPNVSPAFDKDWQQHGYIEQAVSLAVKWCQEQQIKGMQWSIERLENRTPLIYIDIPGTTDLAEKTVLLYGHLDKQPEMSGWDDDKGPWKPVLKEDKLYGRGASDDGYATFSAITAIKVLQDQGIPHPRCVLIIESCEEGGSHDLPYYIELLEDRIGKPDLVVCLDSGCGNYDQLWLTTSLRGTVVGKLSVELLKEGIHSGNGGGVIASSFRVIRSLLDRLEDSTTGAIYIDETMQDIPEIRRQQAKTAAMILGSAETASYPLINGVQTVTDDPYELILNRTWRPSLSYIGADGFPKPEHAGNVLRPKTTFKLSLRIPPLVDSKLVANKIKQLLEANPPYQAKVTYDIQDGANGWNAPESKEWFENALQEASKAFFGKEPVFMGEGGSIPFMNLLSNRFPDALFMITGVLGPLSNAHGPNEFLHLPTVKRLTCCVAYVLAEQAKQN